MKALLLAAGLGTRLGEITSKIPKVLVDVGGKSIIDRMIEKLIEVGASEIVINTHYFHEKIAQHFSDSKYEIPIKLVYEDTLLGTGGTLLAHLDYLATDNFIVMHCDNYFEDSLVDMWKNHLKSNSECLLTIYAFITDDPQKCGVFQIDQENRVISFQEKASTPISNIANGAIYMFKPQIKDFLGKISLQASDISNDILPMLVRNSSVFLSRGFFQDIGTPKGLDNARNFIKEKYRVNENI